MVDMSTQTLEVTLLPKTQQQNIAAMGGVLVANKPVVGGYLADGRPSSSLFYWSHSHFTNDFEFGLHSHEGFEIITVVLDGANSHFDTATRKWADLVGDDVQIIASGSGVSHNERVAKGTHAFQIWFDPNFYQALQVPPTYQDHLASTFTWAQQDGFSVKDIVGGAGPVDATTAGLAIRRVRINPDSVATLVVSPDDIAFCYVIEGTASIAGVQAQLDDLVTVANALQLVAAAGSEGADVFVITLPQQPSYTPVRGR